MAYRVPNNAGGRSRAAASTGTRNAPRRLPSWAFGRRTGLSSRAAECADRLMVGARRRRAWFVYLAVGVAYAVAYLLLPRHSLISSVLDDGGGFACAAGIMVGVRMH